MMKTMSPQPIIARVLRRWSVPPGLTFALVQDVEKQVWVVESCPVGTHFWTVSQAEELPRGVRTRRVLEEAVRLGQRLDQARNERQSAALPRSLSRASVAPEPLLKRAPVESVRPMRRLRQHKRAVQAAEKTLANV
jgi:hypothetical protein